MSRRTSSEHEGQQLKITLTMHLDITIDRWKPQYREAFWQLNREWIEADYPLEEVDINVLQNPEIHILSDGGSILSAVSNGQVAGVVALRPAGNNVLELTKMAVAVPWRGRGIGKQLLQAALEEARQLGAGRVILYSNTRTSARAVRLYRKMGFREIPLETGIYQRADIKMELTFDTIPVRKTAKSRLPETDLEKLTFGTIVSDHMLVADYKNGAWQRPEIVPYENLSLPPATMALHYGQIVWEGMKAFRLADSGVSVFRIDRHARRINRSLQRMAMPAMPEAYFRECIRSLVSLDAGWVPGASGAALYIRPLIFASDAMYGVKISDTYRFIVFTGPVPPFYPNPLKVKVEEKFIRAAPGGTGAAKCAGNYGGSLYPASLAKAAGFDQILWTDGSPELNIEESGTMNVMFVLDGKLVTPPLSDTILDGITRDSILALAPELGMPAEERTISAFELVEAHRKGLLQEAFGVGTAAVTAPFELIQVQEHTLPLPPVGPDTFAVRVRELLQEIRTGLRPDPFQWNTIV
ncbi:MAG: branched-chain amino acid aminotransferase [Bacteroidetes bacterium]|nr:MAG: branched-chain amino acid aminotransferase [Bacteroidota bacterium]